MRASSAALIVGALALTACSSSAAKPPGDPRLHALAVRYLAIANPANEKLDHDFDALEGKDKDDLAAATADLDRVITVERDFDRDLLSLSTMLPSDADATAHVLVVVNESRAGLTAQAAVSTTVAALRGYETRLDAANADVEDQVRVLRTELRLPPPDTS